MAQILYEIALFAEKLRSADVRKVNDILAKGNRSGKKELEALRDEIFADLIRFIYKHNDFYRERIASLGLTPSNFTAIADIQKLPYLTKTDIKANRGRIETASVPECGRSTSGGTTGEPIYVSVDTFSNYMDMYSYYRGLSWMGYNVGDSMVKFFGGSLSGNNSPTLRSKIKRKVTGEVFLPAFDLRKDNAQHYLDIVKHRGHTFVQGYVSSIYTLAVYARELNYKGLKIKGAFTTAEQLPVEQADFIRDTFKCEVKSFYGCAEINCLGFQEKQNGSYTTPTEVVYLENTVHPDIPVNNAFLLTSLHNRRTPLLRYLNGDSGDIDRTSARYDLITNLSGRTADMFIKPDGSLVSSILATQTMQITGLTNKVKKYQLIQDDKAHITFRYEQFSNDLTAEELNRIIDMYRQRIGQEFTFTPVETSDFIKTSSGKHRLMINQL